VKRTTVKIPEELDARLRHEAQRTGRTISEVTRTAIEVYLGVERQDLGFTASGKPRVRRLRGAGSLDDPNLPDAARMEEFLAEAFRKRT
jgi:predicted DNA-binding protein